MYLGKIVEIGPRDDVYERAGASVHAGVAVGGAGARPAQERDAAAHHARRRRAEPGRTRRADAVSARGAGRRRTICASEEPALIDRGAGHPVACHFAEVRTDVAITAKPA